MKAACGIRRPQVVVAMDRKQNRRLTADKSEHCRCGNLLNEMKQLVESHGGPNRFLSLNSR
jgi:hypothetical protein